MGKKNRPVLIRQITSKMAGKMPRNHRNQIFQVDLKAVLEGESQSITSIVSEEDCMQKLLNEGNLPDDIKQIVKAFNDRFTTPTELPPDRPEDMKINSHLAQQHRKSKGYGE